MKSFAKMAMINAARGESGGRAEMRNERSMYDRVRSEYDGGNWGASEMRRGRAEWEEPEMRRYKNGRFAPKNEGDMRYEMEERYEQEGRNEPEGRMNRIGFAAKGNVMDFPGDRMEKGHGGSSHFDREIAEEWTRGMKNGDGSKGPHWTFDQVSQIVKQKGIQHDPYEFWAVLNAIYSDYCSVLKKHNIANMDVYIDLAKAWLEDEDAVKNKAMTYFECIVK